MQSPWRILANSWVHSRAIALGDSGKSCQALKGYRRIPWGILRVFCKTLQGVLTKSWCHSGGHCLLEPLEKLFKVFREVLTTSWGHSWATALGIAWGSLSQCSYGLGHIPGTIASGFPENNFEKSLGCLGHMKEGGIAGRPPWAIHKDIGKMVVRFLPFLGGNLSDCLG